LTRQRAGYLFVVDSGCGVCNNKGAAIKQPGEYEMIKSAILLALLSTAAGAEVRDLSLDLKRMPYNRDLLFPGQQYWGYETRLNADVDIGRFFMDNQITGRTYDSRYRYVSWGFDVGIRLTPWLDIVHSHLSQHAVDLHRDVYPVVDSTGIRLKFMELK
jgi:hypothetical protein